MLITVTQENIDNGRQCQIYGCPVALAFKDAGIVTPIIDGVHLVTNIDRSNVEKYRLPLVASDWINAFDNYGRGRPFSFELELPTC